MLTKSWWENWKFRIRASLIIAIALAIAGGGYLADQFNKTGGQGYYFPYLQSSTLIKFGVTGGRAMNGDTHAGFVNALCGKYPRTCRQFEEKTRDYFITYPLMIFGGVFSSLVGIMVFLGVRKRPDETHRRGAELATAKDLRRLLKKKPASIHFGGVPFPFEYENRHLLLVGAPGSGKSVAIQALLAAIRDRGDRAFIVDLGGAYVQKHARPGDDLLNPFDKRGRAWSPFAEGVAPWEIEAMARSFIPPAEGSSAVWADLAKTVLAGLIEQCRAHGIATNHHLAGLAASGDPELLAKVLKGHPAAALVSSGSPQTIGSILTNLTEKAAGLRYLPPDAGDSCAFSIAEWVRSGKGWLFQSCRLDQREALKSVMAAQIDVFCRTVLTLPPDEGRRIWLVIDELPLLAKIPSIVEFTTNARKYGGCAVLGIQALSQLRETSGRETATTLLSCLASQLVLRMPDPETADYLSKMLGEHEISRHTQSEGKTEQGQSRTRSESITNTRVVLPAEIQKLPNLAGFLCLPAAPVGRVELEIPKLPDKQTPFIPAELPPRRPLILPAGLGEAAPPPAPAPAPAKPAQATAAPTPAPADPDELEIDDDDIPESAFEDAETEDAPGEWADDAAR